MTDRYRSSDDLVFPFIFIPHGAPESPEVAAFKARYPGWFTIPATFVPRAADEPDHWREEARSPEPSPGEFIPSGGPAFSSMQAFERLYATMNDPESVLGITRAGEGEHKYPARDGDCNI